MKKHSLRIKEHADPFCYIVESESRPNQPYFVDLTQRQGHGACNCTYYSTNARPNHAKHGKFIPYRTDENGKVRKGVSECKHISVARNYYHMNVTQPMLAQFKGD
jgi:hypothetical protein